MINLIDNQQSIELEGQSTNLSKNTKHVTIKKIDECYSWNGEYKTRSCIFAKYGNGREVNPWGRLDELENKGVINHEQNRRFGDAIARFDAQRATNIDLQSLEELAVILGMEILLNDISN